MIEVEQEMSPESSGTEATGVYLPREASESTQVHVARLEEERTAGKGVVKGPAPHTSRKINGEVYTIYPKGRFSME